MDWANDERLKILRMDERLELFEAKVNLRFDHMGRKIDNIQSSLQYMTTLLEQTMRSNQNSLHSTLKASSVSVLTESAEVEMRERLEQLRDVSGTERTTLSG